MFYIILIFTVLIMLFALVSSFRLVDLWMNDYYFSASGEKKITLKKFFNF